MWLTQLFNRKSRNTRRSKALAVHGPAAACRAESLESRRLLTIIWSNEGSAGSDTDGFNAAYGSNAATAREIVNHAIDDWNATLTSGVNVTIEIGATDLSQYQVLGIAAVLTEHSNGAPATSLVAMDDDGEVNGWFFDTTVENDSEFSEINAGSPFAGTAPGISSHDFYTVILHELGHAIGYAGHSTDTLDIMAEGTDFAVNERRLISDAAAQHLSTEHGYGFVQPSQRDTLHVNYDSATGDTIVTPVSGTVADSIWVEASTTDFEIYVNGTLEVAPLTGSLEINGGAGNDSITISMEKEDFRNEVIVNGDSGNDYAYFRQGNFAGPYNMTVWGNKLYRHYIPGGPSPHIPKTIDTETLTLIGSDNDDKFKIYDNSYSWVRAYGGDGDDSIWGGNGRDILIGGLGEDSIGAVYAAQTTDEDLIIGGTTSWDDNTGALQAIRNEWISGTSQANISGTGGGGLNGSYYLNSSTIQDDLELDNLTYHSMWDWVLPS